MTSDQRTRRGDSVVPPPGSTEAMLGMDDMRLRTRLFQRIEAARDSMLGVVRGAGGAPLSYPRGTHLIDQGDIAVAGFVVDRGRVKVGRLSEDGSRVILKVAPAGDFIGLVETLEQLPYTRYAEAMTEAVVWRLDRPRIVSLLEGNLQFARAMLTTSSLRFLESQLSVAVLHAGPIRVRLVHLLMTLAHETAVGCRDGCVIDIDLDQEEMASMIGTTRQSVSSLLSALKHEGLIRGGDRTLTVPVWEPILAWAAGRPAD